MDPVILSWNAGAAIYALAIFVFQIFDPVPLARDGGDPADARWDAGAGHQARDRFFEPSR